MDWDVTTDASYCTLSSSNPNHQKFLFIDKDESRIIHHDVLQDRDGYINSEEEDYVGGFEKAGIDGMLDAMSSDFDAWAKGFVPNAVGDPAAVPPLEESFLAMHPRIALQVAKMIFHGDQREVLDAVTAPCTIVQVKADLAAPPIVAEYMRIRMKGAAVAVEIIDSVGHFPQLVAPQQLLDILDGVLRHGEDEHGVEQVVDVEIDGGIDITA